MQRLTLIAAFAALGLAASANSANDNLESRVIASDGWVAYRVPLIAGVDGPCCYSVRGSSTTKGCDLDKRSWSTSDDDVDPAVASDEQLAVYLKVNHGRIDRIRAVAASCPVHTASTVRWIDSVDPANSVAMLSSLLDRNAGDGQDHGLIALAHHADPSALRALTARAEPKHSFKEREQSLFWLGQIRGAEGADVIQRYATTDPDSKFRAKAIFALSQSKAPETYSHILKIARNDTDEEVRGQAFFWMAQMEDARAKDDILEALKAESSDEVREKAVFALSQLKDGSADEGLIAVLRGDYPRVAKKQAMFWLGQSGSPQAMAYFDEALK
jgi:hypothetical protein